MVKKKRKQRHLHGRRPTHVKSDKYDKSEVESEESLLLQPQRAVPAPFPPSDFIFHIQACQAPPAINWHQRVAVCSAHTVMMPLAGLSAYLSPLPLNASRGCLGRGHGLFFTAQTHSNVVKAGVSDSLIVKLFPPAGWQREMQSQPSLSKTPQNK